MKPEIKTLCDKAKEVYSKYVTMEGCDKEELDTAYNELTELSKTTKDIDILEALHLLLKIKLHKINGVEIQNGVRVKYTIDESGVVATSID